MEIQEEICSSGGIGTSSHWLFLLVRVLCLHVLLELIFYLQKDREGPQNSRNLFSFE